MSTDVIAPASPMAPEIVQARDALAASEITAGNSEWAEAFKGKTFDTVEAVHMAYATRDDEPTPVVPVVPVESPKLAGKFESPEALEKAYLELQSKMGQKAPETPPKAPENPLAIKSEAEAAKVVESANLSMDDLQTHYNEHGSLSADHYSALAKSGLDEATVNGFIGEIAEARGAKQAAASNQIFESVGGEEAYVAMVDWAKGNLSAPEIASYNKATDSGDLGLIQLATQGLHAKYKGAVGSGGTDGFIAGQSKAPSGISGFESQAEMVKCFNDERMKSLPSYQALMKARMERTTTF